MLKKVAVVGLCLLCISGCQQTNQNRGTVITIENNQPFPSFLAGIWRQEGQVPREFVISADGRIASAVLGMGLVRVSPGKETRVPLMDGTEGVFVPGPWTAYYDPDTRILEIGLEMSSFRMQSGSEAVEGVIRETFEGPISQDGKQWDVHYFALPEYHAYTSDGKHHVLKDGGNPDEQELVFYRVYSPFQQSHNMQ